jgi:hypothetical protein
MCGLLGDAAHAAFERGEREELFVGRGNVARELVQLHNREWFIEFRSYVSSHNHVIYSCSNPTLHSKIVILR